MKPESLGHQNGNGNGNHVASSEPLTAELARDLISAIQTYGHSGVAELEAGRDSTIDLRGLISELGSPHEDILTLVKETDGQNPSGMDDLHELVAFGILADTISRLKINEETIVDIAVSYGLVVEDLLKIAEYKIKKTGANDNPRWFQLMLNSIRQTQDQIFENLKIAGWTAEEVRRLKGAATKRKVAPHFLIKTAYGLMPNIGPEGTLSTPGDEMPDDRANMGILHTTGQGRLGDARRRERGDKKHRVSDKLSCGPIKTRQEQEKAPEIDDESIEINFTDDRFDVVDDFSFDEPQD